MARGSLFHSYGAATGKTGHLYTLVGLAEEIQRQFPCVKLLRLMTDEMYGGWFKCIALFVTRLYLNSM